MAGEVPPGQRSKHATVRSQRSDGNAMTTQSVHNAASLKPPTPPDMQLLFGHDAAVHSILSAIFQAPTLKQASERVQFSRVILPQATHSTVASGGALSSLTPNAEEWLMVRLMPTSLPPKSGLSDWGTTAYQLLLDSDEMFTGITASKKRLYDAEDGPTVKASVASQNKSARLNEDGHRQQIIRREPVQIRFHANHVCGEGQCDPGFVDCKRRDCIIRVVDIIEKRKTIVEEPTEFLVDRKVIALASPYFKTMLLSDKFGDTGRDVVELHEIKATVLNAVLCIADDQFNPSIDRRSLVRRRPDRDLAMGNSLELSTEDFEQVMSKAQQFLLNKPSLLRWIDRWAEDGNWDRERLELAIGSAYHLDAAGLFRKWTIFLMLNRPAMETIEQTVFPEDNQMAAPKVVFDQLDAIRQAISQPFVVRMMDLRAQCKPEDITDFLEVLRHLGVAADGVEIPDEFDRGTIRRWRSAKSSARQCFRELFTYADGDLPDQRLNPPDPWGSWYKELEEAAALVTSSLGGLCLDCLKRSIKHPDDDKDAWEQWAKQPMGDICRVGHGEQDFRYSFTGSSTQIDSLLNLRANMQRASWSEEEKTVWQDEREASRILWQLGFPFTHTILRTKKGKTMFDV